MRCKFLIIALMTLYLAPLYPFHEIVHPEQKPQVKEAPAEGVVIQEDQETIKEEDKNKEEPEKIIEDTNWDRCSAI